MSSSKNKEPYIQIPKALVHQEEFQDLRPEAILLYGLFADRSSLSAKNRWCDKNGDTYFVYTHVAIMKDLRCASNKATALVKELVEKRLVTVKPQGQGNPHHLYIHPIPTAQKGDSSIPLSTPLAPEDKESGVVEPMALDSPNEAPIKLDDSKPDTNDPKGGEDSPLSPILSEAFALLAGDLS